MISADFCYPVPEVFKIPYVSLFDAFEQVDEAMALELLKQEVGEFD
jgi:hypothetical protein